VVLLLIVHPGSETDARPLLPHLPIAMSETPGAPRAGAVISTETTVVADRHSLGHQATGQQP
jgi:hypothetical protein